MNKELLQEKLKSLQLESAYINERQKVIQYEAMNIQAQIKKLTEEEKPEE